MLFPSKNDLIFLETNATPLNDGLFYTSATHIVSDYSHILGNVNTDQNGILYADFSANGTNWYSRGNVNYVANDNLGFKVPKMDVYCRFRFQNNSGFNQAVFSFTMKGLLHG